MSPSSPTPDVSRPRNVRFAAFELDLATRELKKHGVKLRLAEQPFRILAALLARPGELVSRAELQEELWPGEAAGDFEQGLNRAVSKLRDTLNDRAASARLIETLPGRGYRFVGTIEAPAEAPSSEPPATARRWRFVLWGLAAVALCGGLGVAISVLFRPPVPQAKWRKLTNDNYVKFAPALSDGTRIYFAAAYDGEQFLAQVPVGGGHPVRLSITPPAPSFVLHDLSPDSQELLIGAAPAFSRERLLPLWSLRVADGAARRLGNAVAASAAYAPSGEKLIAYATRTELWVAQSDGAQARRLLELKDSFLDSVCWSPDGTLIRFSRHNLLSGHGVPWEVRVDGEGLRKVISNWKGESLTAEGWWRKGGLALFGSQGAIWGRMEAWSPLPVDDRLSRLSEDTLELDPQFRLRGGERFHTIGTDRLGELQRFDERSGTWAPLLEGLSIESVDYSPDRQRMTYVTYPQRALWVRQADGSRPIQLTSQPLNVSFPQWSPDGKQIVFGARQGADQPVRLYLIEADGGSPRLVAPQEPGSQRYPTWSPDGQSILYDVANQFEQMYIRVADIKTGKVTKLPGSDGVVSPRRSPDGKIIAGFRYAAPHQMMLFHVKEQRWQRVEGPGISWPNWTPDSQAIYGRMGESVFRYRVDSNRFEVVTEFKPEEWGGFAHWMGVGLDGRPLRTLNRDSRQIYAIQF